MEKDFAEREAVTQFYDEDEPKKSKKFKLTLLVVLAALLMGISFFAYRQHYVSKLMTLIKQPTLMLASQPMAAKAGATIKFEFYSSLPAMGVTKAISKEQIKEDKIKQLSLAAMELPAPPAVPASLHPKDLVPPPVKAPPAPRVINSDEVEKQISAELKPATYLLDAGLYFSMTAAKEQAEVLNKLGLKTKIIKMNTADKESYRLHLGPFVTKEAALSALANLEKGGFKAVLRKA